MQCPANPSSAAAATAHNVRSTFWASNHMCLLTKAYVGHKVYSDTASGSYSLPIASDVLKIVPIDISKRCTPVWVTVWLELVTPTQTSKSPDLNPELGLQYVRVFPGTIQTIDIPNLPARPR